MRAVSTPVTSVSFYETTRTTSQKTSHLQALFMCVKSETRNGVNGKGRQWVYKTHKDYFSSLGHRLQIVQTACNKWEVTDDGVVEEIVAYRKRRRWTKRAKTYFEDWQTEDAERGLVGDCQHFRGMYRPHFWSNTLNTLVISYNTRHQNTDVWHLPCLENLKSQTTEWIVK